MPHTLTKEHLGIPENNNKQQTYKIKTKPQEKHHKQRLKEACIEMRRFVKLVSDKIGENKNKSVTNSGIQLPWSVVSNEILGFTEDEIL